MTLYSTLFPDIAILKARKWFKSGGNFDFVVPAASKWCRLHLAPAGGYGDNNSGGGAFVRHRFPVTVGENLKIQIGNPSTQTEASSSFVKRNDGTLIAYADRGRGNGNPGLAANSTGEIRRDGTPGGQDSTAGAYFGYGGDCVGDDADLIQIFGRLRGARYGAAVPAVVRSAEPGGGGKIGYYDDGGDGLHRLGHPGGAGLACFEFFDLRPPL